MGENVRDRPLFERCKKCPNRFTSFLVSAPSAIAVLVSERAERHFGHYAFEDFKSLKERNYFAMFKSRRRLSKTTGSGVWELGKNISVQSSATLWWQCLPSRLQILPLRTLKGSEVTLISVLDIVVAVLYSGGETKYLGCQSLFFCRNKTHQMTAFRISLPSKNPSTKVWWRW